MLWKLAIISDPPYWLPQRGGTVTSSSMPSFQEVQQLHKCYRNCNRLQVVCRKDQESNSDFLQVIDLNTASASLESALITASSGPSRSSDAGRKCHAKEQGSHPLTFVFSQYQIPTTHPMDSITLKNYHTPNICCSKALDPKHWTLKVSLEWQICPTHISSKQGPQQSLYLGSAWN